MAKCEVLDGLQRIQATIIEQVTGRGATLGADDFAWNHGQPISDPPPDRIRMEIRTKSKHVTEDWLRIQLEDSWSRIDRTEVQQEIDRIVEAIAPRVIRPYGKGFTVK